MGGSGCEMEFPVQVEVAVWLRPASIMKVETMDKHLSDRVSFTILQGELYSDVYVLCRRIGVVGRSQSCFRLSGLVGLFWSFQALSTILVIRLICWVHGLCILLRSWYIDLG
jgi:hypothetical protein